MLAALDLNNPTIIRLDYQMLERYPRSKCPPKRNVALMRVSRQIYQEAASLLYKRPIFRIDDPSTKDFMRFCRHLTEPSLKCIHSMILACDRRSLLALFGVKICGIILKNGRTRLGCALNDDPTWTGFERFKRASLGSLTSLQYLSLAFPPPHCAFDWGINTGWACQRVFCTWIWAAARPFMTRIPTVEFKVSGQRFFIMSKRMCRKYCIEVTISH